MTQRIACRHRQKTPAPAASQTRDFRARWATAVTAAMGGTRVTCQMGIRAPRAVANPPQNSAMRSVAPESR